VSTPNCLGLTVYGCEQDEAELFHELCPRFGVVPTITSDAVSETIVVSVPGNRCISVGHKSEISASMLRALKDTGVEHVSTRSIGVNHIDLHAAAHLGITVENAAYAPDGVADYTLMLMLMAIRNAKETVSTANKGDFRLRSVRGKELRDLTVGVVGVGNIGKAVIRRLQGFGCRVLAYNNSREVATAADFVSQHDLLLESDIVTIHMPLNADTHHFIGREQLETMKEGAFLINTGRGALVDTDALLLALESGKLGGAAAQDDAAAGDATLDNPLRMAQLAYDAGMLIEPEEYSAWTLYARAVKAQPNNPEAVAGLTKVADDLVRRGGVFTELVRSADEGRLPAEEVAPVAPDRGGGVLDGRLGPVPGDQQRVVGHDAENALGQRLQQHEVEIAQLDGEKPEAQAHRRERKRDRITDEQDNDEPREHQRRHQLE